MTVQDWISTLSIVVLIGLIIVIIYLIVLLHRANRVVERFDHLTGTFKGFVSEIVPAIVSMGTISTAIHSILRQLSDQHKEHRKVR